MSAKNIYHECVIRALTADGWNITDDPYKLTFGDRNLYVDLGAEQGTVAAEKEGRRIAVEIQSFLGRSPVRNLEEAVGQYVIYRALIEETERGRFLYLALPLDAYEEVLADRFGQLIITRLRLSIIVFDEVQERIVQWIG
jgi:hypothetical protein